MDINFKEYFIKLWAKYFPGSELPIIFYYTNEEVSEKFNQSSPLHRCVIFNLGQVREGNSLCLDNNTVGCFGGKRYLGFSQNLMPDFEFFLSCGIEGKMEGERFKKSPELVKEQLKYQEPFKAPGKYIVFKRWDALRSKEEPLAVIFFASPDVLSGLFALANFDEIDPNAVIAPMCAGCASIVYYPYKEAQSDQPKAVLGMFDIAARLAIAPDILTFAVPWAKFVRMVENIEESFLIMKPWNGIKKRISNKGATTKA